MACNPDRLASRVKVAGVFILLLGGPGCANDSTPIVSAERIASDLSPIVSLSYGPSVGVVDVQILNTEEPHEASVHFDTKITLAQDEAAIAAADEAARRKEAVLGSTYGRMMAGRNRQRTLPESARTQFIRISYNKSGPDFWEPADYGPSPVSVVLSEEAGGMEILEDQFESDIHELLGLDYLEGASIGEFEVLEVGFLENQRVKMSAEVDIAATDVDSKFLPEIEKAENAIRESVFIYVQDGNQVWTMDDGEGPFFEAAK